jgi:Gluconate 2-dehydrogenase subunit 3
MSRDASASGLSLDERRALASVLDELIPPSEDGQLPGAGEIGLASHIERALRLRPELRAALVPGLAALDAIARGRGAPGFSDLSRRERLEVLRAAEVETPTFLPTLTFLTYVGYYENPRVLEALGLEARPPFPEGHEVEPTDFSILDPVRERAPMYRK